MAAPGGGQSLPSATASCFGSAEQNAFAMRRDSKLVTVIVGRLAMP